MQPVLDNHYDALVIGAGAGGICSAARLAHAGYRVLLVEALDRVGGRASTRDVNGFLCNTGALVIEKDGAVARTYADIGLALDLHEVPRASTVLKIGGHFVNMTEGFGGWARNAAPAWIAGLTRKFPRMAPKPGQSTREWINGATRNSRLHMLVDNLLGAMFAASADDFPADMFVHYFDADTCYRQIGLPRGGTVSVWVPLVAKVEQCGGDIWLSSKVQRLHFDAAGQVDGATILRADGTDTRVSCRVAVSNAGPLATKRMAGDHVFAEGYGDMVEQWSRPAAILTAHIGSDKPLADFPCLALFARSRRLVYAGNFSAPELGRAPPGKYLYCAASVPKPSTGDFDVEEEKALLIADLRDHFPQFDPSMILTVDVTAHEWPAQRAITGHDLPQETPVPNLWNVGDGVKPWGMGGTASCAETARLVTDEILRKYPLYLFQKH